VGFNRRFSPLATLVREKMGSGPMSMLYRINAGVLPSDSWIRDRDVSGGRVVGEVCHFIDLMTFLNGSLPQQVQAFALSGPPDGSDTININVQFGNGSIGAISYFANGSKELPKEYLEVYRTGAVAILRDFKEVEILTSNNTIRKKLLFQDKGQVSMVRSFLDAVRTGGPNPISFEELRAVSLATFRVEQSLLSSSVMSI